MSSPAVTEYLNYILVASIVTGLFSIYFLISFFSKISKRKLIGSTRKLFGLFLFSIVTGFLSLIIIGTKGYQALTHEALAATITITPTQEQHFIARIVYPDGYSEIFNLVGDEVMFEANILKWKPWSNVLGLKTAYRLDRIRGRFINIEQEKNAQPTLFDVNTTGKSDIADWREDYQHLSILVDVEHGSASYVSAKQSRVYELFVTTNGLLFREKI